jgi:hypothetical protein
MRVWLGGLALVVVIPGSVLFVTSAPEPCSSSHSATSGFVLPGGPQNADEALRELLADTGDPELKNTAVDSYERVDIASTRVEYVREGMTIRVYEQTNGWMVDRVDATSC